MPLLNYTSKGPVAQSVAQIQDILAKHGATSIHNDYDGQGHITGLAFQVQAKGGQVAFRLPAKATQVQAVLVREYEAGLVHRAQTTYQQAERVAWRILKDWIEAQMALLESEMVEMTEIFLPYLITGDSTYYEKLQTDWGRFLLPEGTGK
jgi:hypothetical protein